jgi:colanic acid/amylovoran biosynthesis glycosyltransferase
MYPQIGGIKRYSPLILCKATEHLDRYPVDHVQGVIVPAHPNPAAHLYQNVMRRWFAPHYPAHIAAIDRYRPAILHSHHAHRAFRDLSLRRRHDLPHVISTYGADVWQLFTHESWRPKFREMFAECDLFLAEGPAMAAKIAELGCPEEKVAVLHLSVDLDAIVMQERRPDDDGTVRFLMCGRPTEKKGMVYGAQAFVMLAQKYPQIRLSVIATPTLDEHHMVVRDVKQVLAEGNCADKFTWYEHQLFDEYIRLTREAHVFLSPSVLAANGDAEGGCPLTVIELSAAGMPIVGSDHCDIPEAVVDGEGGFIVPQRDAVALAERMEHLILHPEIWPAMGRAGRSRIDREFNQNRQPAKLEALYDLVLS